MAYRMYPEILADDESPAFSANLFATSQTPYVKARANSALVRMWLLLLLLLLLQSAGQIAGIDL